MDRLTPLDGSFLRVETRDAHMHVAWCGLFKPPEDRARPSIEELRDYLLGRLERVPRFRQRLAFPPAGLGEPFWVGDAAFDNDAHVTALTEQDEPVSLRSFERLTNALLSEPLDRRRPLWHLYLVPRLQDDRIGLVCKLHHAMVDGVSVVELGLLLLDSRADADIAAAGGWKPAREPGLRRLTAAAALATTAQLAGAAKVAARAAVRPSRAAAAALATARRASRATEDALRPAPKSRVNTRIGPERILVRHEQPLDPLLAVKRRERVTLNDVCLAVAGGALRQLAERRGEDPVPLKTMVPVSTRADNELTDAGNRLSFAFIDLPLDEPSPARRLQLVHEQTEAFKRGARPEGFEAVMSALGTLPGPARGPVARLVGSPRVFNLVVSNIPGPREAAYMLGAELNEAYPVVPLAADHALAIGMFSYRDRLFFGCYADPHALPEAEELPELLRLSVSELKGGKVQATAGRRRTRSTAGPGRRRSSSTPAE